MGKNKKKFKVLAVISMLIFLAWSIALIVKCNQFDRNFDQYIKRAANANTVELAKEELGKALSYVEEKNLTEGNTSIFFENPKKDIKYWYKNMNTAYKELENLPENATSLEKINVLMNLRETLTENTGSGLSVIKPDGINLFPYHVVYFWLGLCSIISFFVFFPLGFFKR